MGVFRNGTERTSVFTNGAKANGVWTGGINRLGDSVVVLPEFEFPEDAFEFSVTRDGDVTLNLPNPEVNGTISSATWLDGGSTGPTSMTITRTNTVVVNVPDGYENTGETVTGTVTATQVGSTRPTVVTNNPTFVASNSFTMNGQITDQGGYPILESGFFYVGYSTNSVNSIISGTYQNDGGDGLISESVSASPNSSYSYVAAARNQLGWSYGSANILTTPQIQQEAQWVTYPSGQPYGGTLTSTTTGTFGSWTGGSDIQPTTVGSTPTSACCAIDQTNCTLSRSRTNIDHYTGATQEYVRICTITQNGAGTATCDGFAVGTEQDLPSDNNATRNVVDVETQTESVTNSCFEEQDPVFGLSDLTVYSCTLSQNGQSGSATTNVGTTTTKTSFNNANSSTNTITVNATFTIQFPIPSGYQDAGSLMTLSFTTACTQPGVEATPEFTPNSANVIFLAGVGGNPQQSAGNGAFITVAGNSGQNYTVTTPSATGGTVSTGASGFGAGTFSLVGGGGRLHTFTLSGSPETYSFTVAAGGAPSGGGGFF